MLSTILIVDDRPAQLRMTEYTINQKMGYATIPASKIDYAARWVISGNQPQPDMILVDLETPSPETLQFIREIKAHKPQLPILVLTQYGHEEHASLAVQAGANDFITTPVIMERLKLSIENALKIKYMSNEMARLERKYSGHVSLGDLVGNSEEFRACLVKAEMASASHMPIWIEGEQGVGKETLARAIHGSGLRAGQPFVVLNCANLQAEDAESVLFGREWPGNTRHFLLGKLREAHEGTLYLHEINQLAPKLQERLLEVILSNRMTPVGTSHSVPVDVRVICSHSNDIQPALSDGTMNEQLFNHVQSQSIHIPALRTRKQDIEVLSEYFLRRFKATENKSVTQITTDAVAALEAQQWPGNVRQLANLLHRAALLCSNSMLDAGTLRLVQQLEPVHYQRGNSQQAEILPFLDPQGKIKKLRSIEEEAIRFALRHSEGCMTRAARSLGIGRSTLYRKLDEMGVVNN